MMYTLPWPPLHKATLVRRYKRFLADVILESGAATTAHCPNSGSMTQCSQPGRPVYVSFHDNPKRKLKYTWQLIDMPGSLVGVNTQIPNRLVYETLVRNQLTALDGYADVRREVNIGAHTRIDIHLSHPQRRSCYLEIKNCTLVNDGIARFPDAVTARGLKHLNVLAQMVGAGHRCVMLYLVQRMDANRFEPADDIDAAYGRGLRRAQTAGVEILVYDVHIDLVGIRLNRPLAYRLDV